MGGEQPDTQFSQKRAFFSLSLPSCLPAFLLTASTYRLSGSVLGARYAVVNNIEEVPALTAFTGSDGDSW